MAPRNKTAAALERGAQKAELAAMKRQVAQLRATVSAIESRLRTGWQDLAARLKQGWNVDLPLQSDGTPTRDDIEAALAEVEAFNVRTDQLARQQVLAAGFDPDGPSKKAKLERSFAACFRPKPKS